MERFLNSIELMRASWEVLKKDKEILFIPVISGMSLMVMIASFVVPAIMVGYPDLVQRLMHEDRNFSLTISFVFIF